VIQNVDEAVGLRIRARVFDQLDVVVGVNLEGQRVVPELHFLIAEWICIDPRPVVQAQVGPAPQILHLVHEQEDGGFGGRGNLGTNELLAIKRRLGHRMCERNAQRLTWPSQ
jgi:hypothetical protein